MVRVSRHDRGRTEQSDSDRGQLVLVAAFALALALVSLGIAYLQLGYHDDVTAPEHDAAQQLDAVLDRAVHNATVDVARYSWDDRDDAVQAVRDEVNDTAEQLETSRLQDGHAYLVGYNETRADQWMATNCPGGEDRQFGSCEATDGVTVQERDDQTHVLAVAFDLVITTPDGDTAVTLTVEIQAA